MMQPGIWKGGALFISAVFVLQSMSGGVRYLRSGGAPDRVAKAKNTILRGLVSLGLSSMLTPLAWLTDPSTPSGDQILTSMGGWAAVVAGMWLLFSFWSLVPPAVAAYSAWWMRGPSGPPIARTSGTRSGMQTR